MIGNQKLSSFLPRSLRPFFREQYQFLKSISKLGSSPLPKQVIIETNSICNRSCDYCPKGFRKNELSTDVVENIIDSFAKINYAGVFSFHGYNEPLTDKRIMDFLALAREKLPNAYIYLPTNGDFLTEQSLKSMEKIGIDEVRISIHAPTLEDRVSLYDEFKSQSSIVTINDMRPQTRKTLLTNRAGNINIETRTYQLSKCSLVLDLPIRASGKVLACPQDYYEKTSFGNVSEKGILEIWQDSLNSRKQRLFGKEKYEICRDCRFEAD